EPDLGGASHECRMYLGQYSGEFGLFVLKVGGAADIDAVNSDWRAAIDAELCLPASHVFVARAHTLNVHLVDRGPSYAPFRSIAIANRNAVVVDRNRSFLGKKAWAEGVGEIGHQRRTAQGTCIG